MGALPAVRFNLPAPGRKHRRTWVTDGRAHIEVRGLAHARSPQFAAALRRSLGRLEGVNWVAVDAALARVVVAFDDEDVDVDDLIDAVESVEDEFGVSDHHFPVNQPEHPGDVETIRRHLLALAADGAGLAFAISGRMLRSSPLPVELAAVASLLDNEPRLRRLIANRVGVPAADLGLALANALGQALTRGAVGLVADMAHRANLLAEATSRRQVFEAAEQRRWGEGPRPEILFAPAAIHRPVPLPGGPVERYADRAALAALAGGLTTLAATGNPRRASAIMLAGMPKAGRLGRDAFAAHLARALGAREVLVLDAHALRRLDRVDTVVIDQRLIYTGRSAIRAIKQLTDLNGGPGYKGHRANNGDPGNPANDGPANGNGNGGDGNGNPAAIDPDELYRQLGRLFDPQAPLADRQDNDWQLGPPLPEDRDRLEIRRAQPDLDHGPTLILRHAGEPVAVIAVEEELSAVATHLIGSAHRQGHMVVIAGDDLSLVKRAGADLLVGTGDELPAAIQSLQTDGCVVAAVTPGGAEFATALWTADVGVEVVDPAEPGAGVWAGDLVVPGLAKAAFVIDALAFAHHVSRQCVAIAAGGGALGVLLAFGGLPGRAAGRAGDAANLAALVGIGNGIRAAVSLNRKGGRVPPEPTRWHELDVEDVLTRLGTTRDGLDEEEAARRRQQVDNGSPPSPSLVRSVAQEFANPLTPVLAAGAGISAAVGSVADAVMVASVSVFNALLGGVQRFGAERAVLSLSEASATPITVRRPDGEHQVPSDQLVPGDVIILRAGDAVPADCRLLEAEDLEVDESAVTGESEPVGKDPAPSFSPYVAERTSMLYEGTTIAAGQAVAVVVAVGPDTMANQLGNGIDEVTSAGGVEARLRHLTSVTLPVSLGGGVAVVGLGLLRGQPIQRSIGSAVALAVAAVPEGLPLLATVAQLASARRLSHRGALVRNPRAIEALGRTRVLCTDKTGTLTEGRIQLQRVSDGVDEFGLVQEPLPERYRRIVAAGLRATPQPDPGTPLPHLTDRAVVNGAARLGVDVTDLAPGWQRLEELPFEPARGYHATVGSYSDRLLLSVKGAPESVLERCRQWASPSGLVELDDEARARLTGEVERLARQGLRLLAVAEGPVRDENPVADGQPLTDELIDGLDLLGFLILTDPVRPTAAKAVDGLRRAGVNVAMVTGDHPSTAEGIAVQLGILNGHRVLTGAELANMSDDQLAAVVDDVTVYARVTPADKVRIVRALQQRGQAVAMTGDGANDAPAIKLADVGIAVGTQSTPAARRAADLVVTDERIETIVDAIIEGRAMWASVKDALAILLGGNLGEVAFTVGATAVTGRAPLSPRQLLAVNLLTDVAPALAIAVRPPSHRTPEALLDEGPDASLGRSLERTIAVRAASTALGAGTAWALASLTGGPKRASTTALIALVGAQLGQTLMSSGWDPVVVASGVIPLAALVTIVQVPVLSQFCGCTPLDPVAWTIAGGSTVVATAASVVGSALVERVARQRAAAELNPVAADH